jgi:hypothetical protein
LALAGLVSSTTCHAEGREPDSARTEPAGLPIVAGSTDIGIGLGFVGSLARIEPKTRPYRWRVLAQVFAAARLNGDDAVELTYQDHYVAIDLPELAQATRLMIKSRFVRNTLEGYFGLGNAAPAIEGDARRHSYDWLHPSLELLLRLRVGGSAFVFFAPRVAYNAIGIYEDSKLATDLRSPVGGFVRDALRGTREHALLGASAGVALDTRDDELAPSRGTFHDLSVRVGHAIGDDVDYGGVDLATRLYAPILGSDLVLAARLVVDLLFGAPPFYELARVGGIDPSYAPGGGGAVRGVPTGRYAGRIKTIASVELRAHIISATILEQRLRLGAVAFFDAGRVLADYEPRPELDVGAAPLKYGTGGGLRLQWGEAFLSRWDAAWSPDGVGVYVELGHAF